MMPSSLRGGAAAVCFLLLLVCSQCASGLQQKRDAISAKVSAASQVSAGEVFRNDVSELHSFLRRRRVQSHDPVTQVDDVQRDQPAGVNILYRGVEYGNFERPIPEVVETTLFADFEEYYNQTQEFHAHGPNTYMAKGRQLVVSIQGGRVSGVLGDVHDSHGRVFTEFSTPSEATRISPAQSDKPCKNFKKLATAIQKYGHMYHHFVLEVVPRIILLKPFLDGDTKLLLFGSSHEFKWLSQLGIPTDQVEIYDPDTQYCADELLVPSLSPIITPPKENYELLRSTFQADLSSLADGNELIIYCSRRDSRERIVSNEETLLSTIRQLFPSVEVYVYTGQESVAETIRLFRLASVVIGMHGAGLSHIVFAPPGTAVVEFLFMPDPPMMFWHAAAAMQQRYIMVPLAQSWWLEGHVAVEPQDMLDALSLALDITPGACKLGYYPSEQTGQCLACSAGSYRPAGSIQCLPCAAGRHAAGEGSAFCSTCPAGSFSDEFRLTCTDCPGVGSTVFPGAYSSTQCISLEAVDARMKEMFSQDALTEKLVSLPALEITKPRTTTEWIAAAVSPHQWYQVYHRRQLRHQYLKELFNSDIQMRGLEADNLRRTGQAADLAHRRQLSGYKRRRMQAYH